MKDSMTVNNMTFAPNGGTLDVTTFPMAVYNSWTNNGFIFQNNISSVTFVGTTSGQTIQSGGQNFSYVNVNGNGGYWTLQDSMTVISTMTITKGTLDASTQAITVNGSWMNTGGFFTSTAPSMVTLTAPTTGQKIQSRGQKFPDLFINAGPSSYWILKDSVTVSTLTFALNGGTLDTSTQALTVNGSWINGGGIFQANSSSVTFTGTTPGLTITVLRRKF